MLPIFINTQVMRKASYALASMHLAFSINSFFIFSAIGFLIQFELISLEKFSLYILFIHMKEFESSFFYNAVECRNINFCSWHLSIFIQIN